MVSTPHSELAMYPNTQFYLKIYTYIAEISKRIICNSLLYFKIISDTNTRYMYI